MNEIIEKLYRILATYNRSEEEYDAIDRAISALEDYQCITASKEDEK